MRSFKFLLFACLGCILLENIIADETTVRKPNFLFIITDDQRWDALGVVQKEQGEKARFPWFESPAMDRLAAEGVRFTNAFVTLSLCGPSRAAFLTGKYSHKNGVRNNERYLPRNSVTHATLLREAGYTTAYIGKWHMWKQPDRPGFDYAASFIGQGVYQDCTFIVNGTETPTEGWVDDVSTTFAIDWLKANKDRPFSMVLGFKSPHNRRGGINLPPRLRDLYADKVSRPVPNIKVPAIWQRRNPDGSINPHRFTQKELQLDYLRHIKGIDENLGRLLNELDTLGLTEDTVVVFTSDNGYFLGEHNCGDKRALYEESIRIPMIVRYPRGVKAGQVVDAMVLNVDLTPTYLDLVGLPAAETTHGRSLKPLLEGTTPDDWRKSFVAHYYKELGDVPTCVALRTETEKLVIYPGRSEWTEVFNLKEDPYEVNNLSSKTEVRDRLRQELENEMEKISLPMPFLPKKPRK